MRKSEKPFLMEEKEKIKIVRKIESLRDFKFFIDCVPIKISDIGDPKVITPFLHLHKDNLGLVVSEGKVWFDQYKSV